MLSENRRPAVRGVFVALEVDRPIVVDGDVFQDRRLVGCGVVHRGLFVGVEADGFDVEAVAFAAGDGAVGQQRTDVVLQHRRRLGVVEPEAVGGQRRLAGRREAEKHLADGFEVAVVGFECHPLAAGVETEAATLFGATHEQPEKGLLGFAGVIAPEDGGDAGVREHADRDFVVVGDLNGEKVRFGPGFGRFEEFGDRQRDAGVPFRDVVPADVGVVGMASDPAVETDHLVFAGVVECGFDVGVIGGVELVVDGVFGSVGTARALLAHVCRGAELRRRLELPGALPELLERRVVDDVVRVGRIGKRRLR